MSDAPTVTPETVEAQIMPSLQAQTGIVPSRDMLEALMFCANAVAESGMKLPNDCRTPQSIFAKFLLGWEHGIRPMTALYVIDYIDGKAALNAMAMVATVRSRQLGNIELAQVTDEGATVHVTKAGWPEGRVEPVSYTLQDALRAELLAPDGRGGYTSTKKNWRQNRQAMFVARAQARAYKWHFQEAALGLAYTPDELGDDIGAPIEGFAKPAPPAYITTARASDVPAPTPPPTPAPAPTVAPAPVVTPVAPAPPIAPQAPLELLQEAAKLKAQLAIDDAGWSTLLRPHGVTTLRQADEPTVRTILETLRYLDWTRRLRAHTEYPADKWAAALQRRGKTLDLELSLDDLRTIYTKLAEALTPFKLAELRIGPAVEAVTLGNAPSPAAEIPSPPAIPVPSPMPQAA